MGHSQAAQQINQDYNQLYQLWHDSDEHINALINPVMSYKLCLITNQKYLITVNIRHNHLERRISVG